MSEEIPQALGTFTILEIEYEEQSSSGIIIPDTAIKYKKYDGKYYGKVISV